MINTKKLQGKIRENSFTLKTLSKKMDISATSLFNKIHNKVAFSVTEVTQLKKLLNMTLKDMHQIFFTDFIFPQ